MAIKEKEEFAPPKDILKRLPPLELLREAVARNVMVLPERTVLVRAAWNEASVIPQFADRTYRFGPPERYRSSDGRLPFFWWYLATNRLTAIWESRLCVNDTTRPGSFQFSAGAGWAIIAELSFGEPLRLFDLNGVTASKLGIFDELSGPDYDWSQLFGCMLHTCIVESAETIHGICYPSRKHRGQAALAISSHAIPILQQSAKVSRVEFRDSEEYAQLQCDPCFVEPL